MPSVDLRPTSQVTLPLCYHCDDEFKHHEYPLHTIASALRQNHVPDDAATGSILSSVIDVGEQFQRYDEEIARLGALLDTLTLKRQELAYFRDCCSSILSPIRRLPPEILQDIFIACQPTTQSVIPVVGQVCHHWRTVVLGTPRLWQNVWLWSAGGPSFSKGHAKNFLNLFTSRSTPLPLNVSLSFDREAVRFIREHSSRWRTLWLPGTHAYPSPTSGFHQLGDLRLDELDFPALERIELEHLSGIVNLQNPITPILSLAAATVPKLTAVVLHNRLDFWELPWKQLTSFHYHHYNSQDALRVLNLCPQLVECSLNQLCDPPDPLFIITPCHMRRLESLRLAIEPMQTVRTPHLLMEKFLSCITAPRLKTLEIIGQCEPADVQDFLARGPPELENLSLGTSYMLETKVIEVLEFLPRLKTLSLDADIATSRSKQNRVVGNKLIRRMTMYPGSSCLVPCLTHLSLKTALNVEPQSMIDMLESRSALWAMEIDGVPTVRLKSADIDLCGRVYQLEQWAIDDLHDLAIHGLQLTLQLAHVPVYRSTDYP